MKIALYHPWIHLKGGGERVILEIAKRSRHDVTIFTHSFNQKNTYKEFKNVKVRVIRNIPIIGEVFRGLLFTLILSLTKLPLKKYDAFVVSTGGIAEFITIRNHSIPLAAYVHTPLRPAHDKSIYEYKLKEKRGLSKLFYKFSIRFYRKIEKEAWKRFNLVFCNSLNTASRLLKAKLVDRKKIRILHPGADIEKFKPSKTFDHYFFYPSRITYYKAQDFVIDAFSHFKEKYGTDFKLVIAGGVSNKDKVYYKYLLSKVKKSKYKNDIIIKTNVSEQEFLKLYRNCYAVLFAAFNEDWGIIPIEAMAAGKPIISVNEGGPRESVIDGKTGFLVERDIKKFAETMHKLASNKKLVMEMGKNGIKEAKKYTWKEFIKRFDNQIEKLVGEYGKT